MKLALIDMGSNSIRLLLGEYRAGQWHNQPKLLWTTRLGKREEDGNLSSASMEASFQALREIHIKIQNFGAQRVRAFATSAVREAPNGSDFMEEAARICPMEWSILSGQEEAVWGFRGAVGSDLEDGRHYAIIDIGGGSTELALGSKEGVYWTRSYPIGAVRLQALSNEGPQRIWEETKPFWDPMPIQGNFGYFLGIGGTITTLAAIDLQMGTYDAQVVQGYRLSRERIEAIIMDLRYKSSEERKQVLGLPAGRADIIVAGAEILTSFMDAYEVPYLLVSDRDGMEGIQAWESNCLEP